MIKLLKGVVIVDITCLIAGAIVNFIFGDIVNGLILILNAAFEIIVYVPIVTAYNRSLSNEEKIKRLQNENSNLMYRISTLEKQIILLNNKLGIAAKDTVESNKPNSLECPFCGNPISEGDKECSFCGFNLVNG